MAAFQQRLHTLSANIKPIVQGLAAVAQQVFALAQSNRRDYDSNSSSGDEDK
ncbi:hypothetical protein U1Q18_025112, partial [Sarracenia purpurea var. burkii]